MSDKGKSAAEVVADVEAWLDGGTRGTRQWDGYFATVVEAVLRTRGWERSPRDEGYSKLRYRAFRHAQVRGRVHVTEASFLGVFTQVERVGV